MCLVILAIGQSPAWPLVIAANRDEFHARATQKAGWWPDRPKIYGGRDLQAGGSWLLLHREGRFATVTNYRDAQAVRPNRRSRGHLVTDFLDSQSAPLTYLEQIDGADYAGFNLIVGDADSVAYCSNRGKPAQTLGPGIYGLSNALLDDPWDKVRRSKQALSELFNSNTVNESTLFRLLDDRNPGPIEEVDATGLGFTMARAITAPFIQTPSYGTRCSTVILVDKAGTWRMTEKRFDAGGRASGESRTRFAAPA
ncbi:MAG: NRDE family protein [Woeseiaceae bacterium]|nr:NRDE family protein [Woeseiaceae bacterium]